MASRTRILTAVLVTCGCVAGCAGSPEERPAQELTRARTLIDQAEKQDAPRFAAADLERARDKLQQADQAVQDEKNDIARRLAVEAALDAELATARASSAQAQKAAEEVQRSVATLEQEATREAGETGAGQQ